MKKKIESGLVPNLIKAKRKHGGKVRKKRGFGFRRRKKVELLSSGRRKFKYEKMPGFTNGQHARR